MSKLQGVRQGKGWQRAGPHDYDHDDHHPPYPQSTHDPIIFILVVLLYAGTFAPPSAVVSHDGMIFACVSPSLHRDT